MKIKVKLLHEDAVLPRQGRDGDAAWDLVAVSMTPKSKYIEYGTGVAIAIPEDHVGLIFPRSSGSDYDLVLSNCVGVIDHNYRGEIKFRFKPIVPMFDKDLLESPLAEDEFPNFLKLLRKYEVGDKIGQLIVIPRPFLEFEKVDELDKTNRGDKGFGSSGN